jgi:outer membrane lipoprotein SlyB
MEGIALVPSANLLAQGTTRSATRLVSLLSISVALATGCRSPYYADQGAMFGGLTGAGVGAAIGSASGNTGTGAVLGSAVGALSGAVVGNELDNIRAENQAMIDQRLAQRTAGATTMHDVVSMSQSGLSEEVIANHVRTRGVAQPPSTADLIALKNAGVSDGVIRAVQEMSAVPVPAVPVASVPVTPVVVEEHYIAPPPFWGPRYVYGGWHHRPLRHAHHHHRPGVSWGVSFSN